MLLHAYWCMIHISEGSKKEYRRTTTHGWCLYLYPSMTWYSKLPEGPDEFRTISFLCLGGTGKSFFVVFLIGFRRMFTHVCRPYQLPCGGLGSLGLWTQAYPWYWYMCVHFAYWYNHSATYLVPGTAGIAGIAATHCCVLGCLMCT